MTRYEVRTTDRRAAYFERSAEQRAADPWEHDRRYEHGKAVQARAMTGLPKVTPAKVVQLRPIRRARS